MHFLRELIHEKVIDLQYCPIAEKVAYIFTKPFTESKYAHIQSLLGVWDISSGGSLNPSCFILSWREFFPNRFSHSFSIRGDILYMGTSLDLVTGTHLCIFVYISP
jgi:hypothetical protein